jgi:hypothetical protein
MRLRKVLFLSLLALGLFGLNGSVSSQNGATLFGTISDDHGQGIPNLEVKVSPPRNVRESLHMTTTSRNGSYRISNLRRGQYLMEVSLSYRLIYRGVVDTSNGNTQKDVVLRRK